ncbi:MAG: NTP transferase domain-containing protein, partial [Selenomonadaceae bacterium]|nr:NTP transferase domain-containing protein [Selenomonadaceae bacterium]
MQAVTSVVISCAGIGSRLGLGTTKALIDIHGKSMIQRQLEMLESVEDIRIVVGFGAARVIEEVRKYRPDAIFVFNHEYFSTKTGYSYYLGARDGNTLALEYDGDLLVHPEDMEMLLHMEGEWIAYADKTSEDAVYVQVDSAGNVLGFSREEGDFEWTGPCCMKKEQI